MFIRVKSSGCIEEICDAVARQMLASGMAEKFDEGVVTKRTETAALGHFDVEKAVAPVHPVFRGPLRGLFGGK